MMLLALLAAALPISATWLLLRPARREGASPPLQAALAIGLGLGVASCTFFLALLLADGRWAVVAALDVLLLAAAVMVARRAGRPAAAAPARRSPVERLLAGAVLIAASVAALAFLANTADAPHGRWDAWATWNLRARWLIDGPAWRDAFAKPTIHGDYPLLLPAAVARLWAYGTARDPLVPAGVAAAYGAALVLLLYAALAVLRDRSQGLLGALCLLGTPLFLRVVPWQYADVPLAFNLLALVALLALADRDPAGGRALRLWAGAAAGLLAWTKNEGMALLVGIVAIRVIARLVRGAPAWRAAGWFAAGLLVPAAIVAYFKLALAPPSSQLDRQLAVVLQQLLDPSRYAAILQALVAELAYGTAPILLALAAYALLLGRTSDRLARRQSIEVAWIVAFAALAYGLTYLAARVELSWLLGHSMNRLLLQVWPTALFGALLCLSSPAEHAPSARRAVRPTPARPRRRKR